MIEKNTAIELIKLTNQLSEEQKKNLLLVITGMQLQNLATELQSEKQ